jgi:hypothetical protein
MAGAEVQFYAAWALAIVSQVRPERLQAQLVRSPAATLDDVRQMMRAVGASVPRFNRHAGTLALAALSTPRGC